MKKLLIVESPAKAKTIEKYLGADYSVKSSVGHIRQIPPSDRDAIDIKNGFETKYEIDPEKKKIVADLRKSAKEASEVMLATDPDREGEAIAWHLAEVLKLNVGKTKRVTYHEITKSAIEEAIENPRTINMDLVSAQQARQILDRIVGYELSPVVWRKVPGGKSAGRVQSPALRLIVEREREIEKFESNSIFKVSGDFKAKSSKIKVDLTEEFDNKSTAEKFLKTLIGAKYTVTDIATAPGKRTPPPPFTTATLQIEASSKFGYSARTTMSAAQGLYQAGLITYHRTDSISLSAQAIGAISGFVKSEYGEKYVRTRNFKTKSASAQEAHEAIRPTHIATAIAGKSDYEKKIYGLIRSRALATQMAEAILEKTTISIQINELKKPTFEAKGEVILFDGFLKVYGSQKESELPKLATGDNLSAEKIVAHETFAKPPARYTEGSLVKKLESLGIGRPSTYATIMEGIQNRGYAVRGDSEGTERELIELILEKDAVKTTTVTEKTGSDKGKLVPTDIGKVLSDFLTKYFDKVVDYGWTAIIENDLDDIATGKKDHVKMLRGFYRPFHAEIEDSDSIDRKEVTGMRKLGVDPKTKLPIFARIGRFGPMLQLGEGGKDVEEKPEFISLDKKSSIETITLEQAIEQINAPRLPRIIGKASDGVEIIASKGPFGNYLKCDKINVTMPKNADPFKITLAEAEKLYQDKLDSIIADWGDVKILKGKYGPYIKGPGRWNNVRIPKETDPKSITEADAKKLLDEKPARKKRIPRRKKR